MKRIQSIITAMLLTIVAQAQTLNVNIGSVTYKFPATQTGEMTYSEGTSLTIMGKTFTLTEITNMTVDYSEVVDNTVNVKYENDLAKVTVAGNVAKYLNVAVKGAHVKIEQNSSLTNDIINAGEAEEITYILSGNSSDGEFYMEGSAKSTLELDGLTLTNATPVYNGAVIGVKNGKRIKCNIADGTENTLADSEASTMEQKGALYVKGHLEFKGNGTLHVYGKYAHAIKTGEYIEAKKCTINVHSAVKDGINCNQYFLMESGTIEISGVNDDGIQCDLDGSESTGELEGHDDEDSGNIYVSGGNISIITTADAAKGMKSEGDINISGGNIAVSTSGGGVWDEDDIKTKASACLGSDGNMNISGGTINLTSTGAGGKGLNVDGNLNMTGGNTKIITSGQAVVASSSGTISVCSNANELDKYDSDYKSSPKGIKADGTITIGGDAIVSVTTSGVGGEGIESKYSININGGQTTVNAYDDAVNSSYTEVDGTKTGTGDFNMTGGMLYARSTNNDGLDANGNCYIKGGLVYAIGARQPEVAIDSNSEEQKKLYIQGGTIIAIGGIQSGSELTQSCYSTNSWKTDVWYSLTYGQETIAFKTPNSGGSSLIISASEKPSVKYNVTADGTLIFDGAAYINATTSGGSTVSLSNYSGNSGGPGGGR